MYKLCFGLAGFFIAQRCTMGMSGTMLFWQQISPYYQKKGNALKWAKNNNKDLVNDKPWITTGVRETMTC